MADSVPVVLSRKPAASSRPVIIPSVLGPDVRAWQSGEDDVEVFQRGRQKPDELWLTCDRKVSPQGKLQKSRNRWVPSVPNSFGLPAGVTCPGKTKFCDDCYADASQRQPGVQELVDHNYRLLLEAGSVEAMVRLLDRAVRVCKRVFRRRLVRRKHWIFRLHWDGDVVSLEYAKALAQVARVHPDVRFWIYTRSFLPAMNVVPELVGIENLKVYLSIDSENVEQAIPVLRQYPEVQPAYCGEYYEETRELERLVGRRAIICPENDRRTGRRKMELMEDDGTGTGNGIGACARCQVCVVGKTGVHFAKKGVETSGRLPLDLPPRERRKKAVADVPQRDDYSPRQMLEHVRRWPTTWDLQTARSEGEECASVKAIEAAWGSVPNARAALRRLDAQQQELVF